MLIYTAAACTFIAGILHLAIVPMFFTQMTADVIIFFLVSGLAQIFWIIPVIKRWSNLWYYIGMVGTATLIIMWFIAIPGAGHSIDTLSVSIVLAQIAFIILCYLIITKDRDKMKLKKDII